MYKFSQRSLSRLEGVHPHLVQVMKEAIKETSIDFTVLEGLRSPQRQQQLYDQGKSMTLNSRHLTGHAVDVAPYVNGAVSWDWDHYHELAPHVKNAARIVGVPIEWGGDWSTFPDGPHWQLPWKNYPKEG